MEIELIIGQLINQCMVKANNLFGAIITLSKVN